MACCTTVREIVDRAFTLLGDKEREHWTVAQLVGYVNEALCEIQSYRPDAFAQTVELLLQPGRLQRLPNEYRRVVSIDFNGTDGPPINETSEDILRTFQGHGCQNAPRGCYEVMSWSRNPVDHSVFYVNPPVPAGSTHTVQATVAAYPPKHTPDNLDACLGVDCAYDAQVLDWVLARAYEVDIESEYAVRQAAMYRRNFYSALGIEYLQESRFESGNYLGRTEDGESARSVGTLPPDTRMA